MDNKQRPIPFRAVAVHRPPPGERRPAPPARGRLSFAEMLRRGGTSPEPRAMRAGIVAPAAVYFPDDLPEPDEQPHEDELPEAGDDLADELMPSSEAMETLLAQAASPAGDKPGGAPAAIRALASTIAGFCNESAVSDSEGWSVHIDLRPDVLPTTSLDLTVSGHWLQLRFQAGQPASRRLLCEHEAALREQLDAALARSREIAITIE